MIHVPERDLGETGSENGDAPPAPKKRTRRGSRGGKNRRKKPVVAEGAALEVAPLATDEPSANGAEPEAVDEPETEPDLEPAPDDEPESADDWGYTPMSEWGMDER